MQGKHVPFAISTGQRLTGRYIGGGIESGGGVQRSLGSSDEVWRNMM